MLPENLVISYCYGIITGWRPDLKLHLSRFAGQYAFSGYDDDHVMINGERYSKNMVVLADQLRDWAASATLEPACFDSLMDLPVEILLLGTGRKLRFPHPSIMVAFRNRGIGLEVMDTPAACRTYNILLSEGRKVGAALLLEG